MFEQTTVTVTMPFLAWICIVLGFVGLVGNLVIFKIKNMKKE